MSSTACLFVVIELFILQGTSFPSQMVIIVITIRQVQMVLHLTKTSRILITVVQCLKISHLAPHTINTPLIATDQEAVLANCTKNLRRIVMQLIFLKSQISVITTVSLGFFYYLRRVEDCLVWRTVAR